MKVIFLAESQPLDWAGIVVAAIVAALIMAFLSYTAKARVSHAKNNLSALANRLGLAATLKMQIPVLLRQWEGADLNWDKALLANLTETGLAGEYHGRQINFAEFNLQVGKHRQGWVEMAVAVKADNFRFELRPENFGDKLMEWLGDEEVKMGEETFDRAWHVSTNQEDVLRALLVPELCTKLCAEAGASGFILLEYNSVRYRCTGDFSNDGHVRYLESRLDLMMELAEAVEVAVETMGPLEPPPKPKNGYDEDDAEKKSDDWGEVDPNYDRSP